MSERLLELQTEFDFGSLGRQMPRERHQNGWVEKTGKKVKTWTGFWYVYVVEEGVEKRRERSKVLGKCGEVSKGEAEDALRDLIRGKRPPATGATFEQLANWYIQTNEGRWTKKWKGTVKGIFKHQILPRLGSRAAAEIVRGDVQLALNEIAADPRWRSGSLVGKCLTHIRAVFEAAVDDKLLDHTPPLGRRKIKLPPVRKASDRFLSLEECQRLLEVAPPRDYLILRLFMVDGFRPAELFALRVNDVEPGRLRIDQTAVPGEPLKDQAKTESSLGYVPMSPELEAALRAYIREEGITDFLFPSAVGTAISHDNYLDRVLKPLGVLAGIDVFTKKDGTQSSRLNHQVLRRTTGTHFQTHGETKDAQELLRHTDAATTLKYYQKVLPESVKQAVNSWDAALVPRKGPGREDARGAFKRRVN